VPFSPSCFSEINFNIILPSTPRSSKWPPSLSFPHSNHHAPHLSSIRATYPASLSLLELIARPYLFILFFTFFMLKFCARTIWRRHVWEGNRRHMRTSSFR
jgi:hypothetical protein